MKLIAVLFLFSFYTIAQDSIQKLDLTDLEWLKGTWIQETRESKTFENWIFISEHTIEGASCVVSNASNDTIFSEELRIIKMGDEIFYIAKVSHNDYPIPFKLITSQSQTLIFENRNHDFPQKITYSLINNDSLTAAIEGSENNQFKRIVFQYKKLN